LRRILSLNFQRGVATRDCLIDVKKKARHPRGTPGDPLWAIEANPTLIRHAGRAFSIVDELIKSGNTETLA
jgi:hypothetical protein